MVTDNYITIPLSDPFWYVKGETSTGRTVAISRETLDACDRIIEAILFSLTDMYSITIAYMLRHYLQPDFNHPTELLRIAVEAYTTVRKQLLAGKTGMCTDRIYRIMLAMGANQGALDSIIDRDRFVWSFDIKNAINHIYNTSIEVPDDGEVWERIGIEND